MLSKRRQDICSSSNITFVWSAWLTPGGHKEPCGDVAGGGEKEERLLGGGCGF